MQINFGKYAGKTSQEVFLKHGSYVKWVIDQPSASGQLGQLQKEFTRLMNILDTKPFVGNCSTPGCKYPVTSTTGYWNNDAVLFKWCGQCDPYTLGANSGKLSEIGTFGDALDHVELRCGGTQGGFDRITKSLAKAKGLPARLGAAAAEQFLK